MALLATLIPDDHGICDGNSYCTYGGLNGIVPRDRFGQLDFATVLNDPDAPYSLATYERTVMLLTGGFAD